MRRHARPHVELEPRCDHPEGLCGARSFPGSVRGALGRAPGGVLQGLQAELKRSWVERFSHRRMGEEAYAVPTACTGNRRHGFFCAAVARGRWLIRWCRTPVLVLLVSQRCSGLIVFAAVRATWQPTAPLRVARRRRGVSSLSRGGCMSVARRSSSASGSSDPYGHGDCRAAIRPRRGFELLGIETGGESGAPSARRRRDRHDPDASRLALVQAAKTCAIVELDGAGRRPLRPTGSRWPGLPAPWRVGHLSCSVGRVVGDSSSDPRRRLARGALGTARASRGARGSEAVSAVRGVRARARRCCT